MQVNVEFGVCTIEIAGRNALNILDAERTRQLADVVAKNATRSDVRCILLKGKGEKAFVAGADIKEMMVLDAAGAKGYIENISRLCEVVHGCPVPTVAVISGYCYGAGMELAAVCDVRVATNGSLFGMPEVKAGMPSVIYAAVLQDLLGAGRSSYLLLSGDTIDAATAERWGFLDFLVPDEQSLEERANLLAKSFITAAPGAVRAQKSLIREWRHLPLNESLDISVETFSKAFETNEPSVYMSKVLGK